MQEYVGYMKEIQENLLKFIQNEDEGSNYNLLIENITNILEDKHKKIEILSLISEISNHHHRSNLFFDKMYQLIQSLKVQNFLQDLDLDLDSDLDSYRLFNIFKENKMILLILIKQNILKIDQLLADEMIDEKNDKLKFKEFFYPELKQVLPSNMFNEKEEEMADFEDKRKKGVNDFDVCKQIQNDEIDEFIKSMNSCESIKIEPSIFETNPLLIQNEDVSMIEYAAFYGSINIFKYLITTSNELKPSLFLYAIHSNNPELIHILEEKFDDINYEECLIESLKCHHKNLEIYFEQKIETTNFLLQNALQYHNYSYFDNTDSFSENLTFYNLCKYNYSKLVEFSMNERKNIKYKIIQS